MKNNNIHHIGKVVKDIKTELEKYKKLGFVVDETIYTDREQKVRVGKVNGGECFIELLEPLDETSPVWNFSRKQSGVFHHICIKVESIDAYIKIVQEKNLGFRLTPSTKSVWDDRMVCFIGTHEKDIIELIE